MLPTKLTSIPTPHDVYYGDKNQSHASNSNSDGHQRRRDRSPVQDTYSDDLVNETGQIYDIAKL